MEDERVGRGNDALNGSRSSSNIMLSLLLLQNITQTVITTVSELISYNKSYTVDFLLSFYKFFFEAEIFRNTQLLHTEFKDINTDILPNTWSGTNCYCHKRRQNYGFLSQKSHGTFYFNI